MYGICEIPLRSDNKAFKVTIFKSYVETFKVIWPEGIKVDIFKMNKPIAASKNQRKQQRPKSYSA